MNKDLITSRYGKALFLTCADDLRKNQRIARELSMFKSQWEKGGEIILTNPNFSGEQRKKIINKIADHFNFLDTTRNFLLILEKSSRIKYFSEIYRIFLQLVDEKIGRIVVTILSAEKLPSNILSKYRKRIQQVIGESSLIKQEINPDVLGGVIIKIKNKIIDGSLIDQIMKFRSKFGLPVN
jgi:F-type H+-transporting ATPase subunit delta